MLYLSYVLTLGKKQQNRPHNTLFLVEYLVSILGNSRRKGVFSGAVREIGKSIDVGNLSLRSVSPIMVRIRITKLCLLGTREKLES